MQNQSLQTVPVRFYRHCLPVRIMHWINVLSFFIMLMSAVSLNPSAGEGYDRRALAAAP